MENITKTAGIVIIKEEKVLLIRHGQKAGNKTGSYGIPAGHIESNETAIQCAIRELQEETGLGTKAEYLIPLPEIYTAEIERKEGKKKFSLEVFLCIKYSGEIKIDEENIPEWIEIATIKKINLLPNIEKIIKEGIVMSQKL